MADIFISYSHEDQNYVQELTGYLKNKGFSVWVDERIDHGDRWWQTIVSNIRKCAAMVVVMTPDSEKTDWVEKEYFFADRIKKPIFPLLLGGECFPFFVNRHYSDVRDRSMPPNALLGTLKQFVEQANEEPNRKEEDQKRIEEREHKRKEEEQKRIEAARRAEEKRKAEEEQKRKEGKAKITPDGSEPGKIKPPKPKPGFRAPTEPKASEPHRTSNALKFGVVACVIMLLLTGGWFYYKSQQEQQEKETRIKIEQFYKQTEELERSVIDIDNQKQLEKSYGQTDKLSRQAESLSKQAAKVGMGSQLEQLQNRLEQIQNQLADRGKNFKQKEFNEVKQKIEKLVSRTLNLENAFAMLDKPEQLEEFTKQRDAIDNQVEDLSEQATKVGMESQLDQLQERLKQIQTQLAVKEKEFSEAQQELDELDRQASNLEKAVAKLDKLEQIEEFSRQREALSQQVAGFSEQATKAGLKSELKQLQNRLNQVENQLANKETEFKEFIEARQMMEKLNTQALKLENAVAEADNQEQLKELFSQRDTLSRRVAAFKKQAAKVGMGSQLEQLQNRLEQIQNQLADRGKNFKQKEFNEVKQKIEKINRQAMNLENDIVKLDKLEKIKELTSRRDTLNRQVGALGEQATKVGLKSELKQLQNRLKQIQIQLANKENELITSRRGKIFVESVPVSAIVKILNIDQSFRQGMELEPGNYHIGVSLKDYESQDKWIEIGAGEEKRINFELAKLLPPQKTVANSIGMKFVLIPAGNFVMGSPPNEYGRNDDEKQHEVIISKPFYLQITEVSQGQWEKVMGKVLFKKSLFKDCGDDCPVEQLSWNDVQQFIRKLNQREGTNKYRLPTEAEWEYACKAKTETAYSFGHEVDKLGEYAWYRTNSKGQTHPVGGKKPNAWGLYDMHGNVRERVQDWYGDYPSNSVVDPKGPDKNEYRVIRGGFFFSEASDLRSAYRFRSDINAPYNNYIGFRVAKDF